MKTPYHYTVVRCRDPRVEGEHRNVGLLALVPARRKVWLRRSVRVSRTGLVGDEADFVDALLDALLDEARRVAESGDAAVVHSWLRERAHPSEGSLTFALPALGVADDLEAEIRALRERVLGKSGGGTPVVKKLQKLILRETGYEASFQPRRLSAGPAVWPLSHVADTASGRLAFLALACTQKTPENILDAAFRNVGRIGELSQHHPDLGFVGLVGDAARDAHGRGRGQAVQRARELLVEAGVQILPPSADGTKRVLDGFFGRTEAAQAK